MILHFITLTLGFSSYKWIASQIEVIEKDKVFVVSEDNDIDVMRLIPEVIPKSRVNVVLAPKQTSLRQISLSIYCLSKDIIEAKDKLITEIRRLSEAYRVGFEEQAKILEELTHENK